MSYIQIPNPRRKKFWHSPAFILKRVRQHQPSLEELAASLEEKRVRHGIPTAVDRWIAAGLKSGPSPPHVSSAQAMAVPTLTNLLEDLVECQLSTTETKVSSPFVIFTSTKFYVGCYRGAIPRSLHSHPLFACHLATGTIGIYLLHPGKPSAGF